MGFHRSAARNIKTAIITTRKNQLCEPKDNEIHLQVTSWYMVQYYKLFLDKIF